MTKQKQKENPQFAFLYGGPHYNYYQYRVTTEQISKLVILHNYLPFIVFQIVPMLVENFSHCKVIVTVVVGPTYDYCFCYSFEDSGTENGKY